MKYVDSKSNLEISMWQYASASRLTHLHQNEIHIWQADLGQHSEADFLDSLNSDELARANRFHFERDRRRYIVARGILRQLLGGYLHLSPSAIQFNYSPQGKPYLLPGATSQLLHFNLAHSVDVALFAFAHCEIGVDVEAMRKDVEIDLIAPAVFSEEEMAQWQILAQSHKRSAFFSLWSRKEAFVKALGQGIGYPLTKVTVGFSTQPAEIVRYNCELSAENRKWLFWDIPTVADYRAAVVVPRIE